MQMRFEYSAGAFIYKMEKGKPFILFLKNGKNNMDMPKGHIEKGESVEQGALREIREESGINAKFLPYFRESTKYFFVEKKAKILKRVYFFIAKSEGDAVKISEEHLGYRWMDKENAIAETKFKNMKKMLPKVYDYIEKYELVAQLNKEYQELPKTLGNWGLSSRFVPGDGPLDATIMIVGQAPGRNEDIEGKPFVGRSGQALSNYLKKAGIKRERVYITSVVQFFPPENRGPTKEEVALCKPFLLRQIGIIKPRNIILLGNFACEALLGGGKVTQIHGKVVAKDGINYMITFHPAMALRSSKVVAKLLDQDFVHFGEKIASEEKSFKLAK